VLVPESLPVSALLAVIQAHAGASLKEVVIFDVYQGAGLDPGQKSIALGLIWQEASETLVDEQIDDWFKSVVEALGRNCEARLRN
jgi:phenylalanyl-tRNA synthetase beta chain